MRLSRGRIGRKQWVWLGVATVALLAIGAGVGVFASHTYWQRYATQVATRYNAYTVQAERTLMQKPTNATQRTEKLRALEKLAKDLKGANSLCAPVAAVSWQVHFGAGKRAHADCETRTQRLGALSGQLEKVTTYLEQEAALWAVVTPLLSREPLAEATWQAQMDKWQNAGVALEKIRVGKEADPLKKALTERVAQGYKAWQDVLAAHTARDHKAYDTATGQLGAAYENLKVTVPISEQAYRSVVAELHDSYDAAFHDAATR